MKHSVVVIAAGLIALTGTGCAAPTSRGNTSTPAAVAPEGQAQVLRERAAAFWAARMEDDDKTQWELLEPRGKGRVSPQEYASERKGVRYLGYKVEEALIEGYFATVKVRVLFQPILQRATSIPVQTVLLDDHWVRIAGTWYRQLDDRQPPRREP
jgi:hypothetical protein